MRARRRPILLAAVLVLGAFTARYVSIGPGGTHRFDLGTEVYELPLISPTLLGWVVPGDRARLEAAQISADGRWLYLAATRGDGDQLASVTLTRPQDGVVRVDLRLITIPSTGRTAIGLRFATRVELKPPQMPGYPPITIDESTGRSVVIGSYIP